VALFSDGGTILAYSEQYILAQQSSFISQSFPLVERERHRVRPTAVPTVRLRHEIKIPAQPKYSPTFCLSICNSRGARSHSSHEEVEDLVQSEFRVWIHALTPTAANIFSSTGRTGRSSDLTIYDYR
jgi:hypothetical protein